MLALARFGSDPLRFLDGLSKDARDIVPFTLGSLHCHLLKRPEHVKLVLESEDWPPLSRGRMMALDKWYGGGLILTEGAEHHRQRDELWKPVLVAPEAGTGRRRVSRRSARGLLAGGRADRALHRVALAVLVDRVGDADGRGSRRVAGAPEGAGGGHRGHAVAAGALRLGALGLADARQRPHARGPRPARRRDRREYRRASRTPARRRAQPLGASARTTIRSSGRPSSNGSGPICSTCCSRGRCTCWPPTATSRRAGTRARGGARRAHRDRRGPRRAGLHPPADQGVDAALPADPGLLPRGDERLRRRRDDDPRGPRDRDEPVGDPSRRRPVARAAALRPRPLGRRRAATARGLLLPLLRGAVRMPRARACDHGGDPHPRDARSASGPSGPWTNASRGPWRRARSRPRAG